MKWIVPFLLLALDCVPALAIVPQKPNIVVILVDDMGYGDPGCFNPQSKIPTPPPYFYIRGDCAAEPPTELLVEEAIPCATKITNHRRIADGIAPGMKIEEVLPRFTDEAVKVIEDYRQAGHETEQPLNLYLQKLDVVAQLTADMKTIVDDGRSRVAAKVVDRSTLTGKVMVGYQGWFNCEGDGTNLGWTHWSRNRQEMFAPGNVTVDLWPDMSEYDDDERFATGFKYADGSTAEVFSSANRKTVLRHFQWMQQYGIDGAFLQRFAHGLRRAADKRHKDIVLENVRQAAAKAGRSYAVMYDLTGLPAGGVKTVREDWKTLRDEKQITRDLAYQRHHGRPVVSIWGVGFNDSIKSRDYTLAECKSLIEYLKDDGCSVMLGVPTGWRELTRDATADPALHEVLKLGDIISPWTVGRYRDRKGIQRHAEEYWQPDIGWCRDHGLDYLPVVFPGFSWHNLKGDQLGSIPRLKGEFLWSQILAAKRSRCDMLYVAMFDEVDEGTAIFKCTNDPPTGNGGAFLSYEGLPSDFYLHLTGKAGKLIRDEISASNKTPFPPGD